MKKRILLIVLTGLIIALAIIACAPASAPGVAPVPDNTSGEEFFCGSVETLASKDGDSSPNWDNQAVLYNLESCGYENVVCFVSDAHGTDTQCFREAELQILR